MKIGATSTPTPTHMAAAMVALWFALCIAGILILPSCGAGGSSAAIAPCPSCHGSPSPTPSTSPSPSPSPSSSPVVCTIVKSQAIKDSWMHRARPNQIAIVPLPPSAGPASKVCQQTRAGIARCMAWIRTGIQRTKQLGPIGYAPTDLQTAYSLTAASSANGGGQTVAIVDAYDDPNAEADLAVYRTAFALSACTTANGCFQKVNENGATSPLPGTDATGGWEAEESLDLDMVSAICPNCSIILVEGATANTGDLYAAETTSAATCGANVISNSWNTGEYSTENLDEPTFNHPGVMITVAAGDNGYGPGNAGYPATSAYVTSVGGTTLNHSGSNWPQTAWTNTGSLCSLYIAQPAWQAALGSSYTSVCNKRIINDVSAVADPNTGVAVYDSFGGSGGCSGWCQFGGTSASTPIIGAVYALAGNEGSVTYGSYSYSHLGSLTDITSGSNGVCGGTYLCTAKAGFDGPTGNGTPIGTGAF